MEAVTGTARERRPTMTISTITDLVAAIADLIGTPELVDRAELERLVREERTERYEDHDREALAALADRVMLRLDPHFDVSRWQ